MWEVDATIGDFNIDGCRDILLSGLDGVSGFDGFDKQIKGHPVT